VLAGNASSGTLTHIVLPTYVTGTLADTDTSEALSYNFSSLPAGSTIITTAHPSGIAAVGGVVTVPASEFASAQLELPSSFTGSITMGVTVTSTEVNGSAATSASQNVSFTVLGGMGADGYDYFYGDGNANTIKGDAINSTHGSNDYISAGAGNDTISAGAGADMIIGGKGSDTLTGGAGADTFKWALADNGTNAAQAVDRITDFSTGTFASGGDRLDLRDLLVGESSATLDKFVHFNWDGTNTTVSISASGAFTAGHTVGGAFADVTSGTVQQIVFNGVNLTSGFTSDLQVLNDLISKGKLITD
jgi:hypothetical protein